MNTFFYIMMLVAMLAVVVSFGLGMFSMVRNGEGDRMKSNKMMKVRVILQGVALALFMLAYATK